ncbi:drug resistance transporter, EmrB/QacA subfamily [Nonomuraea solani]|uniref:Drug resistance transporter, EmrB/QacA subfamily n=2 Tax=Nonomuraea solani TaxID=1144553 RepID=A0A1H6EU52_9ACTN|nr:drug resistance transporter, EmrB/QacA subfamily [Nonomuraea solani]
MLIRASPETTTGGRWAVLAVVLAAAVLDLLDATITNLAAPAITADLGGGQALVQWLGAGYALALGVLLVTGGRLGDRYGRRRVFLTGLTGFTLASIACGLAGDPGTLIAARIVQGAFGALMIPQGYGILAATFPRDQLGKAYSLFAPALGASSVAGPVLGGFLIQADLLGLGWRAMFLINIVLGGGALLAAVRLLPADDGDRNTAVDAPGAALLGVALLGLLYGLIDGSAGGWSARPFLCLAGGLAFAGLFCLRQRTARNPLIEPSLLRHRGFTAGLVLGVVFFAAVSGLLYVLALFLQTGLGYSPLRAALHLTPVALGIVVASVACHRLVTRLGRVLIAIGLGVTLLGALWLLAVVPGGAWALVPPVFVVGLGLGTCFGTVFDVTMGDLERHQAGSAGGVLSATQQLANAAGAAAVTTVYFHAATQDLAVTHSLLVVIAATLTCCGLVWLLPRRPQNHH